MKHLSGPAPDNPVDMKSSQCIFEGITSLLFEIRGWLTVGIPLILLQITIGLKEII